MARRYSEEFRARAVRMVSDRLQGGDQVSETAAMREIAPRLGVVPSTLQRWWQQQQVSDGSRAGVTSLESVEVKRLRRENAELRRANEILKTASAFFAAELDRPTTK